MSFPYLKIILFLILFANSALQMHKWFLPLCSFQFDPMEIMINSVLRIKTRLRYIITSIIYVSKEILEVIFLNLFERVAAYT